jgi:hypothetical protein
MASSTYNKYLEITKSDSVDLAPFASERKLTDAIYVGGAGIVVAVDESGSTAAFTAVAGEIIPIGARRVNSTTTSATLMIALYQN